MHGRDREGGRARFGDWLQKLVCAESSRKEEGSDIACGMRAPLPKIMHVHGAL